MPVSRLADVTRRLPCLLHKYAEKPRGLFEVR